jgi:membrane-associated protease RseP (regulator of RpoE activity)
LSNDTPTGPPFSDNENAEPVVPPSMIESVRDSRQPLPGDPFVYQPRVKFQHTWWKHIALFVLTGVSMYLTPLGPWYSAGVLAILGAHEMGHYLACRFYNIDATLPYFIPMPITLFGTLGAVIRIREPFPDRKALFDIGIAGPVAGFLVLVPLLFLGMSWSQVVEAVPVQVQLGRPLLYQLARWVTFGSIPDTHFVSLHPLVTAAWLGMLATALNLLPFGQLDGGHITYAALGRRSTSISLVTVASAVTMCFFSINWLLMTVLMVAMLVLTGPRHPPVMNEYEPLDPPRRVLAVFAIVMFALCFTPFPVRILAP